MKKSKQAAISEQERESIVNLFRSQVFINVNLGFEILLSFGLSYWEAFWFYMQNTSPIIQWNHHIGKAKMVVPLANEFAERTTYSRIQKLPFKSKIVIRKRCMEDFAEVLELKKMQEHEKE